MNRIARGAIALVAIGAIAVLGAQPSYAEGKLPPTNMYCTAGGYWGSSAGAAMQAELAAQQQAQNGSVCSDGSTVSLSLQDWSSSEGPGGTSYSRCLAGGHSAATIAGTTSYANVYSTACPDAHISGSGPTGRSIQASPMNVTGCPAGSSMQTDGKCHCARSSQPNGNGACSKVAITVSPTPKKKGCKPGVGDPIYPLTGAVKEEFSLQLGASNGDILNYDTSASIALDNSDPERGLDAATVPWNVVGGYWFTTVDKRLEFAPDDTNVLIYDGAGAYTVFTKTAQNTYQSTDRWSALVKVSDGFRHYNFAQNVIEVFNAGGLLQGLYYASGFSQTVTYSTAATDPSVAPGPGYAIALTDSFGRSLNFTYRALPSGAVRLSTVGGLTESVRLDYQANDALQAISWVQAGTSQTFEYDLNVPWAISAVHDESGFAWLKYGYDVHGRANSHSFGNGAGAYNVSYTDAANAPTSPSTSISDTYVSGSDTFIRTFQWNAPTAAVILPNGGSSTWHSVVADNYPALTDASQPAGAGCAASSSSSAYDSAGDIASRDDFNGNRACYAHDSARGLRTMALEGRANTQVCSFVPSTSDVTHPERLTTTIWHPDWALMAREAAPKKITTWVYNGQPDPIAGGTANCAPSSAVLPDGKPIAVICARYEQATTDATGVQGFSATVSGSTRAWTYTYNQFGQVLTETAPKLSASDSLSHTTTYTYYSDTSIAGNSGHTIGDLQTVTNPLQQMTSFTSYDGAGRLLSSTDPNGVVTTQTYWPRGWLKSRTVTPPGGAAPQLTSFDYWPTGLLKTVTMPDGGSLGYGYDDAHRLTDITDAAGNKLHYVLDDSGNRKRQEVSDASGALASTVEQVFDALNRVQSRTGAAH